MLRKRPIIAEKRAKATLRPDSVVQVEFAVGDTPIEAVLVQHQEDEQEFAVGVHETILSDGTRQRRFIKLPRQIMESKHVAVEFYEEHENLIKGIGAVAVVGGAVAVGSLIVHRFRDK